MNISPNTEIIICQDVPLDNTYEHSIHFGYRREYQNLQNQYNYFYSKRKYTFEPTTYQRVNSNTLRIQMIADNLYNCNYLMFQNTNFRTDTTHYSGDKWFYAFITSVNYVNNAVTEITYELDVIQTWLFDYLLVDAYVERQHSATDGIGDNLIPEPVVPSAYVTANEEIWPLTVNSSVLPGYHPKAMIVATKLPDPNNTDLRKITAVDGIPCYCYAQIYDMVTQASTFNNVINEFIGDGKEEAIVGLFAVPPTFSNIPASAGNFITTQPEYIDYAQTKMYGGTFDGYAPKNNKMYTYPYNKLIMQNSFGQDKEYRFELFEHRQDGSIRFTGKSSALPKPCMIMYPDSYANQQGNVEDALSVGEYPQGVFKGDSYQLWLHQGFVQDVTSVASAGLSALLVPDAGDFVGQNIGWRNVISTTLNTVAHAIQANNAPNKLYGNLDAKATYYGLPAGYAFKLKTERPVYSQAVMIDDFFTRFGYAQNRIMAVDSYVRKHWTYTKTLDCTVTGSVPADDMSKIRAIYNKGITWWVNPAEIGDYSLDNSPKNT